MPIAQAPRNFRTRLYWGNKTLQTETKGEMTSTRKQQINYNYMAVDNLNDFMTDVCGLSGALNRNTSHRNTSHRSKTSANTQNSHLL